MVMQCMQLVVVEVLCEVLHNMYEWWCMVYKHGTVLHCIVLYDGVLYSMCIVLMYIS